jgi:hypothetical protein
MIRWALLAVLVVALTATATVVVQSLPADSSVALGPKFPVPPPESNGKRPRAVVDEDLTYKFGTRAQHTKFEKDWVIKNRGDAPLHLRLEAPPCSCTVAGFQDKDRLPSGSKVVPPKEETTIHFTWETRENSGTYHKTATILTDDPERPKLEFSALGEVHPAVVVYPDRVINFIEVSTDEEVHSASIAVYSQDKPDMKITRLASSKPTLIVAEQEPMTKEQCESLKVKAGWRITVKVKRGFPLATFLEELVIGTDHPLEPELKLTVTGKVVGPISVVPERVRLFNISGSRGGTRDVTLLVRGHRATKFEVVRKPEKFKVEIAPGDNSSKPGKYGMTVTVPPGTPPGTVDDLIILKTDHPQAEELRIPVYGFIRDAG